MFIFPASPLPDGCNHSHPISPSPLVHALQYPLHQTPLRPSPAMRLVQRHSHRTPGGGGEASDSPQGGPSVEVMRRASAAAMIGGAGEVHRWANLSTESVGDEQWRLRMDDDVSHFTILDIPRVELPPPIAWHMRYRFQLVRSDTSGCPYHAPHSWLVQVPDGQSGRQLEWWCPDVLRRCRTVTQQPGRRRRGGGGGHLRRVGVQIRRIRIGERRLWRQRRGRWRRRRRPRRWRRVGKLLVDAQQQCHVRSEDRRSEEQPHLV